MSNIIRLTENDRDKLRLVRKSLINLRSCYPEFGNWFDTKITPNILSGSREVFLATNNFEFSGALILKNTKHEKKICTLFIDENKRYNHLGLDLIRIASEELETYKLPITISSESINLFNNSQSFNFYQIEKRKDMYKQGLDEYIGYLMFHDPDSKLKRS